MEIVKDLSDGQLTVSLIGRLDGNTTTTASEELLPSLDGVFSLVMDFADLEYISSAGLRLLVQLTKVMDKRGGMRIIHARPAVIQIFQAVMFDKILHIE